MAEGGIRSWSRSGSWAGSRSGSWSGSRSWSGSWAGSRSGSWSGSRSRSGSRSGSWGGVMNEIDWNKLAEDYELTVDEFRYQMFVSVAAMGAMEMEVLDKPEMVFTCTDSDGPIYLTICREKKELSNAEKECTDSEILKAGQKGFAAC